MVNKLFTIVQNIFTTVHNLVAIGKYKGIQINKIKNKYKV